MGVRCGQAWRWWWATRAGTARTRLQRPGRRLDEVGVGPARRKTDGDDRPEREPEGDRRRRVSPHTEQRNRRVAVRRLDLLEHMQERRVAAQAGEADHRPSAQEKEGSDPGAQRGRT